MSLFEVPGWSVPSAPVAQGASKKRKRPQASKEDDDGVDEAQRIKSAQKNIEKLMRSLGAGMDALDDEGSAPPNKKKRQGKKVKSGEEKGGEKTKSAAGNAKEKEKEARGRPAEKKGRKAEKEAAKGEKKGSRRDESNERIKSQVAKLATGPVQAESSTTKPSKKQKKKHKRVQSVDARSDAGSAHDEAAEVTAPAPVSPVQPKKAKGKAKDGDVPPGLTALQASMKKSLDGARFR